MLTKERLAKFFNVVSLLEQEVNVNIVIAQIDPDALGAAFCLASIVSSRI